jgi:hypothetical protein
MEGNNNNNDCYTLKEALVERPVNYYLMEWMVFHSPPYKLHSVVCKKP